MKQVLCKNDHYFSEVGRNSDGGCALCTKIYLKKYNTENFKHLKLHKQQYDKIHHDENLEHKRKYRKEHPEVHRLSNLRHDSKRAIRIAKFGQEGIKQFYKNCPKRMVVDHVIPLCGKLVSGLHVSWNLQYLTPEENNIKLNTFDGTIDNTSWKINLF